jgi:hypothetical protein
MGRFGGPPFPPRGGFPDPLGAYYISADGRVHSNPRDAVAASLSFEDSSSTGAGCNQSVNKVPPLPSKGGK